MKHNLLLYLILFVSSSSAIVDTEWWKHSQLYQIYPRSFMDSDGDGIGDIQGITSKLGHLADIGIEAVWLSPVFESPMRDFGYDISNFTKIQAEYGTQADLELLLAEAKKLGIKVLLDFVPNHTSDLCEWFILSANKTPGYENYYVWHPGKTNPDGGRNLPPSNWISVFRNSAWTFNSVRQEYYLHQFLPQQPDLNFREPKVIQEMEDVLKYWLNIGVDGFRVDAIPHLVEEYFASNNTFPDEPLSNLTEDTNSYDYLDHIHTREREETWENIFNWRRVMDEFSLNKDSKIIVMEAFSEIDVVIKYYGNATHEGAHYPFNFDFIGVNDKANARTLKAMIDLYIGKVPSGRVYNWVLGNHDRSRLATRVGKLADAIMMMNMLLPGVSVTYQGEEIGMVDQPLSYEDTQDPQACKDGPEMYNLTSRDPQRTPFQWDSTINAGFSTANKTWLPLANNFMELNLLNQKAAQRSTYKLYKQLSKLRRDPVIKSNGMKMEALDDDILVFSRFDEKESYTIIIVMNMADRIKKVTDLNIKFEGVVENLKILAPSVNSDRHEGDIIPLSTLELKAYESLVLRSGAMNLFNISLFALICTIVLLLRN